jgi:hypothetical protein
MAHKYVIKVSILIIFLSLFSRASFAAAVDLGTAVSFVMYTSAGAVSNAGNSTITGDIGSNVGAISGFAFPTTVSGTIYNPGITTAAVAIDLQAAYDDLIAIPVTDATHAAAFGSGETVGPGVYTVGSAATLAGNITLDAGGDASAIFIFRINGAYSSVANSEMILANGALADNVYWVTEGAISLATRTVAKGTLLAHAGAVSSAPNCDIDGRMLSIVGAVSMVGNDIDVPPFSPLPIELLSFGASINADKVDIEWVTASEVNNDFFTVERSTDGVVFDELTAVAGAGSSFDVLDYSVTDQDPNEGANYYRLKQTDYDGAEVYSAAVYVSFNGLTSNDQTEETVINVFPNPVRAGNNLFLSIDSAFAEKEVLVILINSMGQEVYAKVILLEVGNTLTAIKVKGDITPGVYHVIGSSDNELFQRQIMINKY